MRRNFIKGRFLFVKDNCPYCLKYKEFIERINLNLPLSKRIVIIDCTRYELFGIMESAIFGIFLKYIKGYPALFIEGFLVDGSNSREEAEAFVRARVHDDFIIKEDNGFLFTKECKVIPATWFKKEKLLCE